MDKILQAQMAFDRRAIAVHDIGDRPATKPFHESYVDVTATGRIQQEPTNKCQPEATEICTYEKAVKPKHDEYEGNSLTYLRCQPCRASGVVRDPPSDGPQDPTAI